MKPDAWSPIDPIPIFPLPGCVMLPGAVLPLHVFETRYRNMVCDVLSRPLCDRFIATALLCGEYEHLYDTNNAPIAPVVCIGQVVQHVSLSDGRSNIVLVGRARARVTSEDATHAYRRANVGIIPTEPCNMLSSVHAAVDAVRELIAQTRETTLFDPHIIRNITSQATSAATLIDLAAFHLIDNRCVALKQRILEEERLEVRAEVLGVYLKQSLATWRHGQLDCNNLKLNWPPSPNEN